MSEQQAPPRRPQPPQQAQPQGRLRTELSREELRAHLANVESQVKSALRIIASESKGMQQAHSALRADLSSALVRLQADMNGSSSELSAKLDRLGAEVSFLSRQRKLGRIIFLTFGMTLSFVLGILVIAGWLLVKEGTLQAFNPAPMPIEDTMTRDKTRKVSPSLNERPQAPPAPMAQPDLAPQPSMPPQSALPNPAAPVPALPGAVTQQQLPQPAQQQQAAPSIVSPAVPSRESNQELPPNLLLQEQPRR